MGGAGHTKRPAAARETAAGKKSGARQLWGIQSWLAAGFQPVFSGAKIRAPPERVA